MNPDSQKLIGALEAILFSCGEAISIKKLTALAKSDPEAVQVALDLLAEHLSARGGGLALLREKDTVRLVSAPEFGDAVADLVKKEFQESLTPAAEETLAIIGYAGPIARADIEYIRGSNSIFTLRHLLMRGLVDRVSSPQKMNAYLYNISSDCFRHLGLLSVDGLPEYEKYKSFAGKILEQSPEKINEV